MIFDDWAIFRNPTEIEIFCLLIFIMELYLLDKSYMDLEYIDHCYSFFLWLYYQLFFRSLSRLWFDCLFTRGTDQSISSKEEFTTIILFIYLYSIWLVVNLLVLKMITVMHDLQVFFSHTLLSLLLYYSEYDYLVLS